MGETMNAREELSAAIESVVSDLWDQHPSTDLNVRRSLKESIEVNFDDAFVAIANMESALTEKAREIERLREGCDTGKCPGYLKGCSDAEEKLQTQLATKDAELQAAIQRAENAEAKIKAVGEKARKAFMLWNMEWLLDARSTDAAVKLAQILNAWHDSESALAAARKALEEMLGQFTQPCHPGEPAMSAMAPIRELDRYRAALNGDSHAE